MRTLREKTDSLRQWDKRVFKYNYYEHNELYRDEIEGFIDKLRLNKSNKQLIDYIKFRYLTIPNKEGVL